MVSRTPHALPERMHACGVAVLESHHAPDFFMEPRTHAFLKVIYLMAGHVRIRVNNQEFPCSPGDLVLVPPHATNQIHDLPGKPVSLYACGIAPHLLAFDPELQGKFPRAKHFSTGFQSQQIERLLRRLRFQFAIPAPTQSVTLVSLALELLALILRLDPSIGTKSVEHLSDASKLERYLADLPQRFFEATTLDEAAREAGLSRRRFSALFREQTGESWLPFVRRLAIRHACHLLRETDLAISSISFECGFQDLSTFYRSFKRTTGMSPLEWKRREQSAL